MSRGRGWSVPDLMLIESMRKSGKTWDAVAEALPGRTLGACQLAFHNVKAKRLREIQRAKAQRLAQTPSTAARLLAAPSRPAPPPAPRLIPAPSASVVSTFTLRADAELRARIEVLGVTGGMLGDPLPGRSALDQKRAGVVGEDRVDRRTVQFPPRPTLATGRLR